MKQSWLLWFVVALACVTAALLFVVVMSPVNASAPEAAPTLTEVSPTSAPNDLVTLITITGTGFAQVPTVSLGSEVLAEVGWVSADLLTATVPWGLAPAVYDLTVTNPGGESATMAGAFTVTQGLGAWTTGGPYGGKVNLVVVHPVTPTTVYALAREAGAFVSYDSGQNWELMVQDSQAFRLTIDPGDPKTMYFSGSSLLRTRDGGRTWVELMLGPPPFGFHPVNGCFVAYPVAHPADTGVLYVATGSCEGIPVEPGEGGIFYSDDYGDSFVTRTVGLTDTDLVDVAFHPTDPDKMATAGFHGNVFTTTDGGENWHWAADLGEQLRRIYFDPSGSPEAWIAPHAEFQPPSSPYVYHSAGPGLTTWVTSEVTSEPISSGGIWTLAFGGGKVWAGGYVGYTSNDGGTTWLPVMGGPDPVNELLSFAFPPGPLQRIHAGTEMDGHLRSNDGGMTWQEENEGLAALQVRGLASPWGEMDIIYANTFERGLLRSDDGGQSWLSLVFFHGGAPKGPLLAADPHDADRVYYGHQCDNAQPCMEVSTDRGLTWQEIELDMPAAWAGWEGRVLTVSPHPLVAGRILASAGFCRDTAHCNTGTEPAGFYASDDYGSSWAYLGPTPAISEPLLIAFDQGDPDLVYAGTRGDGLWRSTNGGDDWTQVNIPGTQAPVNIDSIAPHPNISETLYVRLYSFGEGPNPQPDLYFSNDAGANWQVVPDVDTVTGGSGGTGLVFMPSLAGAGPYYIYSGCEWGLCRTPDGESAWEHVAGAPRPTGSNTLIAGSDGERSRLYIGTPGGTATVPERTSLLQDSIPGLGSLFGGGVYRYTTVPAGMHRVWLPLVARGE